MKIENITFLNAEQKALIAGHPIVKFAKGHLHSSLFRNALEDLINKGFTRTGTSGYSKGWTSKSVITKDVISLAECIGLKVEAGNDAPRGGANGEFVKIID